MTRRLEKQNTLVREKNKREINKMLLKKITKNELEDLIKTYNDENSSKPSVSAFRKFLRMKIESGSLDEKYVFKQDAALLHYIKLYELSDCFYIKSKKRSGNQKRFTKDEMVSIINSLTEELNDKPSLIQLAEFINRINPRENYDSYEEYISNYMGESATSYYVDLYNLRDMIRYRTQ